MDTSKKYDGCDPCKEGKIASFKRSLKEKFTRRKIKDSSKCSESTSDIGKILKSTKPNNDSVLLWFKSFENILKDKVALDLFHKYLQSEFSDENLEFWLSCENYKQQETSSLVPLAVSIYNDFIVIQSPKEVNLDSVTRDQIRENVSKATRGLFDDAQHRIEALMQKDSYNRFLSSPLLQQWAQKHNIKLPSI